MSTCFDCHEILEGRMSPDERPADPSWFDWLRSLPPKLQRWFPFEEF